MSSDVDPQQIVACTLSGGDFQTRTASVAALNREHLKDAVRKDLRLTLTYGLSAKAAVHDMVRLERVCCSFLEFTVQESGGDLRVEVVAPEYARDAAGHIFDSLSVNSGCGASCGCQS